MKLPYTAVCLAALTLPAAASQPFDGSWSMSAATRSGTCSTYSFEIGISEGQIRTPPGVPVAGTGNVARNGRVAVQFTAGSNLITATGRAASSTASGQWSAPGLQCSGTWSAQRRG